MRSWSSLSVAGSGVRLSRRLWIFRFLSSVSHWGGMWISLPCLRKLRSGLVSEASAQS